MKNKKKKKPNKPSESTIRTFDIVRIDWIDHWSGNKQWSMPEDLKSGPFTAVSVGIRIKDDEKGVLLAQNMGQHGDAADTMYIIKSCITNIEKIGEVKYGQKN